MNPWHFVTAAYAVVLVASAGIAGFSWWGMRRAEADADALRKRP